MAGVICTSFKFQSVLISPDRFVYARIFWRRFFQILYSFGTATSIKLAVRLILSTTIMPGLLLVTSWSVWIQKFHRILVELFSAACVGWCWYHGMYFSINPCSSSKRTWIIYRRYHGVWGILFVKDHCNLIWCGGWLLFRHGRFGMYHHLQHWRHVFQYIWWKLPALGWLLLLTL